MESSGGKSEKLSIIGESASTPLSMQLQKHLQSHGLEIVDDALVRWTKESSLYPRNWPLRWKIYNATLVIWLDFFISAVGVVGAAAAAHSNNEYQVGETAALLAFTTMFFVGQAIGGVGFPPYSESFGRKGLYLFSTALFAVFSIIIPTVDSIAAAFVGRFVTGLLSSIPSIVAAGSIEDIFNANTRMWLVSLWLIIASLSLVAGPIFAAYISATIGWRWIFYISTALAAVSTILLLAMKESGATLLLDRRLRRIRKVTGNAAIRIENPDHVPDLPTFIRVVLFRPLVLLFTEPIVLMISVISGIAFALVYLFAAVLPIVYGSYGFTSEQSSLAFVALGIGFLCSVFTRIYDRMVAAKHTKIGRPVSPEGKLAGFAAASPAFAIGLWWFA